MVRANVVRLLFFENTIGNHDGIWKQFDIAITVGISYRTLEEVRITNLIDLYRIKIKISIYIFAINFYVHAKKGETRIYFLFFLCFFFVFFFSIKETVSIKERKKYFILINDLPTYLPACLDICISSSQAHRLVNKFISNLKYVVHCLFGDRRYTHFFAIFATRSSNDYFKRLKLYERFCRWIIIATLRNSEIENL